MNSRPRPPRTTTCRQQHGAVAVMVALSLAVLVGAAGLAIDGGRLYINKSELQTAVDACALAASRELVCDAATSGCLENAEAAGTTAAARNRIDLQQGAAPAMTVTFSTTLSGTYSPRASAVNNARYVRCTASQTGLAPWLMGVLGSGDSTVSASAVATPAPSQDFCLSTPMTLCSNGGGTNFGYTVNQWITATSDNNDKLSGAMRWASLTGNTSTTAVRDQFSSATPVCGYGNGSPVTVSNGTQQGVKSAYNTRFGLYPNGANAAGPTDVPPDRTGYAYPTNAHPVNGTNVLSDYRGRRNSHTPFTPNDYRGNPQGGGGNPRGSYSGTPITTQQHQDHGADRRLIAVPVVNCSAASPTVQGSACLLMLNPMGAGASSNLYMLYLGNASASGAACGSTGTPGGSGSTGPRVPTLVQ
ncbi:MAG: hypothetical protein RLZZ592_1014 [Pseudomonadota bacterium]